MNMPLDYPRVRAMTTCPCCAKVKDAGLLTCWPCYQFHDGRGGMQKFTSVFLNLEAQEMLKGTRP